MESFHTMRIHEGWRIPNSVFLTLSGVTIVLTWVLLMVAYPLLPANIPSHFGVDGAADAWSVKTWWSVFLPAMLQIVLTALTWWLSHHPEYSNLPSSLPLRAVAEPMQTKIRAILAHLLVMTGVLVNLIMAYVALAVVRVGLGEAAHMDSWLIFFLAGFLILLSLVYAIWIARLTRQALPTAVH